MVYHTINGADETNDSNLIDDLTVVLATTGVIMTTHSVDITATFTETTTQIVTIYRTDCPTSPSITPCSSSAAADTKSKANDDTPIFIAVAIVVIGLVITLIAIIIMGVLLCHSYHKQTQLKTNNRTEPFIKSNLCAREGPE